MTPLTIAIGADLTVRPSGERQSFSEIWRSQAAELGVDVRIVDGLREDALDRIRGADGFIWRYRFERPATEAAPRLMDAVEDGLKLPVWPPRVSRRYFEDKAREYQLLDALGFPHPKTWIFWRLNDALAALPDLPSPLVAKLSTGVQSNGVALLATRRDVERHVRLMFSVGAARLSDRPSKLQRLLGPRADVLRRIVRGRLSPHRQQGCVILQEFLPDNAYDERVMVQGRRAVAIRRINRPGDFRASGSGLWNGERNAVSADAVALAFRLAEALGWPPLAVDVLRRGNDCVIGEFSSSMAIEPLRVARGHWRCDAAGTVHEETPFDWVGDIFATFVMAAREARDRGPHRGASEGPL